MFDISIRFFLKTSSSKLPRSNDGKVTKSYYFIGRDFLKGTGKSLKNVKQKKQKETKNRVKESR